MLLGNLQKGSLDVMGAVVELVNSPRPGLEWILQIQNPSMCTPFEVAVPSRDQVFLFLIYNCFPTMTIMTSSHRKGILITIFIYCTKIL